ncbi:hypothetical protein M2266_004881 [Streptomyces sp. SPB162]|nr:hypothetical protein [Streptomyces sp. SPB162]
MHSDEGGGAGGVHGDGRAFEAQGVRDAAGQDAARRAGAEEALDAFGDDRAVGAVLVVHDPREDTGRAAAQGRGVDARTLDALPGSFEEQPLLGVGRQGLAGADTEELGVEPGRVVDEAAFAGVRLAGRLGVRVGVVDALDVPAAVRREVRYRVTACGEQVPQFLGIAHTAGETAGHSDDGNGFALPVLLRTEAPASLLQLGRSPLEVVEELFFIRLFRHVGHLMRKNWNSHSFRPRYFGPSGPTTPAHPYPAPAVRGGQGWTEGAPDTRPDTPPGTASRQDAVPAT